MGEISATAEGRCQDETIVYAKIHPSIGIARVGNSQHPDGFYIGPQMVDPAPMPAQRYRDSSGALKREVAQFRLYGYDAAGRVVRELVMDEDTEIRWTVELANPCMAERSRWRLPGWWWPLPTTARSRNRCAPCMR